MAERINLAAEDFCMPQDDICWRRAKEDVRNHQEPDKNLSVSRALINADLTRQQVDRCAKKRLKMINDKGLWKDCMVRMNHSDKAWEIEYITPTGKIKLKDGGLCTPSDCTRVTYK